MTPAQRAGYNIFCTSFCLLADGRLFLAGGHVSDNVGLRDTALYDPATDTWAKAPDMNAGRWYPTVTNLANGDMLVVAGMADTTVGMNLLPQVWQTATGTWRDLTNAQLHLPYYPYMFLAPNGSVFAAGPDAITRYLDTAGAGAWTPVGTNNYGTRNWGSAAMYEPGKVLLVGGTNCPPYDWYCANVTPTAEVIDLTGVTPRWAYTAPMQLPRKQLNLTILPDGRVLATGGSSGAMGYDDATTPAYAAEVWDPATARWTMWASSTVYRGYHSTALLLPDGRILQAAGEQGGYSAEIFSPPYLFTGARPTITSAPDRISYGGTFFLQTPESLAVGQVTLVRLGAVTHSFNQSQRFNRLTFALGTGGVNVTAPATPTVAPPGYYTLFILNGGNVPSMGGIVRLEGIAPPPVVFPPAPTDLTATAASGNKIALAWRDQATTETGFRIERCNGAGCTNFAQIAEVGANVTKFVNTGLASKATYVYRVRAFNSAGNSAYSNTATATNQGGGGRR
jgi:hypothetical protein